MFCGQTSIVPETEVKIKSQSRKVFHFKTYKEKSSMKLYVFKGSCPLSRFVPRPSFPTGVVSHSQPSVGRGGPNRVRWPVSKKPVSTMSIFLMYASLPFAVRQEKLFSRHGP